VLLYGHGHQGTDLSVINRLLFLEPTLVVSVGASGALNPATRRSETTTRAVELIQTRQVDVQSLITHRYPTLETVKGAFGGDSRDEAYIKGVLEVS
jgi:L-iditol 2-dehydrogenase